MKEQEILDVIRKTIELPDLGVDEEAWDSLDLITILQALDDSYSGKLNELNDKELGTAKTPKQLIELLRKHSLVE